MIVGAARLHVDIHAARHQFRRDRAQRPPRVAQKIDRLADRLESDNRYTRLQQRSKADAAV